ncbi:MAG: hypothetical protein WC749_09630 [Dehalococcoidia bacterium]
MSKELMDRVKANQAAKAEAKPIPVVTIQVSLYANNQVTVQRPEGDSPAHLAAIVDLLATAQKIICAKIAKAEPSRIVVPPPGLKVS